MFLDDFFLIFIFIFFFFSCDVLIVLSDEPRQNQGRGLVDRKLVKAQALEALKHVKYSLNISIKILVRHFEEMTRFETSCLGAIPCLVSCLPQRMMQGNVKTFDVICNKRA